MALPLPSGLVPSEVAFLCEMELVTIVPRQRLEPIDLLSGSTPSLRPPRRADVPLWLALLLKKQRRANIVPPPWLHPDPLRAILHHETVTDPDGFSPPPPAPTTASTSHPGTTSSSHATDGSPPLSPPFIHNNTAAAPSAYLPYHWLELAELLLAHAGDDMQALGATEVRSLLRDVHEARAAKTRRGTAQFADASGVPGVTSLRGLGAMELAENRRFLVGVLDGVRKLGASAEAARREEEKERRARGDDDDEDGDGGRGGEDSDDEMLL